MNAPFGLRRGSILLAIGMFLILAVMMVPVPTGMLDLALTGLTEIYRKQEEVLGPWLPLPW